MIQEARDRLQNLSDIRSKNAFSLHYVLATAKESNLSRPSK